MLQFPYIFTFYSFKGGVGRSLALLNTAYTLASRGRHVLVVDMDLEAPGISGFLLRQNELAQPANANPLDVLSLLTEAVAGVKAGSSPKEIALNLSPLSNYIRSVADEKLATLRPKLGRVGRLDILAADLERHYWHRLAESAIHGLPQDQLIALSNALRYYLKAQRFPHRPLGLEPFEPALPTPYDYVLVDSRTGITEVGGLCVGPLADRLVVLTSLNDQNVQGTLSFMQEAGIKPGPRSPNDKPWDEADTLDEDPTNRTSLGPKPTIIVASPVPTGEIDFKRARIKQVREQLGVQPIALSYHPQMALIESVFVRDYPEEYLAIEYGQLTDRMMMQVRDHSTQLAQRSALLWNEKKEPAAAVACVLRLATHQAELGIPLLMQLSDALESSNNDDFWASRQLHALLSENGPTEATALNKWGNTLGAQAKTKAGEVADRLYEAAYEKYAVALKLKPDFHEALDNWGNRLGDRARTKLGETADRLYAAAYEKYAAAVKLRPDDHKAINNWGATLGDQAKTKAGEAADRLYEAAYENYAAALKLKPDFHEALINWGGTLAAQSRSKSGSVQRQLRQAAREKLLAVELAFPGARAYTLACIEAAEGDALKTIEYLQQVVAAGGQLNRKRIAEDTDFDSIRGIRAFVEFLETLPDE